MPRFIFVPSASAASIGISYIGAHGSSANASSYTFTSVNFGSASATREVFVIIGFRQTLSSNTVTAVSIGGVSASLASEAVYPSGPRIALAFAAVPSGSSGNITVTLSGSVSDCVMGVYSVVNRAVIGASETDFDQKTQGTSAIVASIIGASVSSNGFVLTACVPVSSTSNGAVSGLSTYFDGSASGDNLTYFGSSPIQGSPSSGTVQWTWNSLSTAIAAAWSFV